MEKIATRADWKTTDMPEKNSTFILNREFSPEQIAALRRGHIPQEMEDKWFWFMEGNTLYAHRSWTGICVYRIDFSFTDNLHKVTVNQDPNQVGATSEDEDRRVLNNLMNWWSQPQYDHYGEWISETVDMLKRAGKISKDAEDYRKEGLALEQQEKYEHLKKILESIGLEHIRFHDLRHSFAAISLQNGDDIKTVSENLGHATVAFTLDVYGHVTDKMKKDSADRMQAYISSL